MVARPSQPHEYPDDIFAESRMTFGEHIDELRTRMIRALAWLMLFLFLGVILDAVGEGVGNKRIGVGRPMLDVITDPVETQVRDFYNRRNEVETANKLTGLTNNPDDEIRRIQEKLKQKEFNLNEMTADERAKLLGAPQAMPAIIPTAQLAEALGLPADKVTRKEVALTVQVYPAHINYLSEKGQALLGTKKYLSTLSAQEAFVVYFKVSILCGIVLASPMILYQFWAFIGAGLYPHEKRYVGVYLWPSIVLFLVGVLLCQFVVLPGAVKALLKFNEFLGFDPDIRLNEWLGLALILPLVFGVSFQTPLVMVFLNRIGMFSAQDYVSKWRIACFILAVFAAVITPTPDVITMMYLFVPMFGLYLVGIAVCHYFPGRFSPEAAEEDAEEVAV